MHAYRKPNGSYVIVVQHNGHRQKITRPTKKEAERDAAQALIDMGGRLGASDRTVAVLLAEWRAQANHADNYGDDVDVVLGWLPDEFVARPVTAVDDADITRVYRALSDAGRSPFRISRLHGALSGAFRYALERPRTWALTASPMAAVKPPRLPARNVSAPQASQINLLRAGAVVGSTFELYMELAAIIGARRGELVALQWGDVGPDSILIHRCLVRRPRPEVYAVRNTKTGEKGYRTVAIPAHLIKRLGVLRREQLTLKLASGSSHDPLWIFSHDAGYSPWLPGYPTLRFRRLRDELGIPADVKMKNYRHFMATQMLAAGVPLATVSHRLGHSKMTTTALFYAEYLPAADQDAGATIDRILRRG